MSEVEKEGYWLVLYLRIQHLLHQSPGQNPPRPTACSWTGHCPDLSHDNHMIITCIAYNQTHDNHMTITCIASHDNHMHSIQSDTCRTLQNNIDQSYTFHVCTTGIKVVHLHNHESTHNETFILLPPSPPLSPPPLLPPSLPACELSFPSRVFQPPTHSVARSDAVATAPRTLGLPVAPPTITCTGI